VHQPVLYQEIIHVLQPRRAGYYVDCTVGGGGHARAILQASAPDGRLLGLDVDPQAIEYAHLRLAEFGSRVALVQASFTTLTDHLSRLGWPAVDGILLDLGMSSLQLDDPRRGLSFQSEGPLDMRFDPRTSQTAADLVNGLPERELADVLIRYGEERHARAIARAIVAARPISTTRQLADLIARLTPPARKFGGIHPATRTFQALRIAVNRELEALKAVLPQALEVLAPGGRVAVISFHSLEDRIVKSFLLRESRECLCPPRQPVCTCGHRATLRVLTRHPIRPQPAEVAENPRARSARLRVAEKIALVST